MARHGRRIAKRGVDVEAARTSRGRAATTVTVKVDPADLRDDVGELGRIEQVVAALPVTEGESVRWMEERLDPVEQERGAPPGAPARQTFAGTHYGGCDAGALGVRVKLETTSGTVRTRSGGHAGHRVREEDRPEVVRPPKRGR